MLCRVAKRLLLATTMIDIRRAASFSRCQNFRYWLSRDWPEPDSGSRGCVNFIMLNPSTADAKIDDPTIRRVMNFSFSWGFRRLVVTNLFAYRSPSPKTLNELVRKSKPKTMNKISDSDSPIDGPRNRKTLRQFAKAADLIVCAWGNHGRLLGRNKDVLRLLASYDLYCLGMTAAGEPKHPLYLRKDANLDLFQTAQV